MEPLFHHDFSRVRVHTDDTAARSAQAVNADAYAVGRHIVFDRGRYDPTSGPGRSLLAHELAHVVQQPDAQDGPPVEIQAADHRLEAEAARASEAVARQRPPVLQSRAPAAVRLAREPGSRRRPGVSLIEISCASRTIAFHTGGGVVSYALTSCDLTDGTYEAGVTLSGNDVTFNIGAAEAGRRFLFNYTVGPGQPRPATLFGSQRQVRIQTTSGPPAGGDGILGSVPVTFVATEITGPQTAAPGGVSGAPLSTLGLGGHVLATGDLSWLSRADAARRVLGPEYWRPFVPQRGNITLDRVVNELPRDLRPRIEAELAAGQPLSWTRRGFTQEQLVSVPELLERLNRGGLDALTPVELDVLRRAAGLQGGVRGGSSPGSPLTSFSRPNADVPLGGKQYRVRVEVPRGQALDLSGPSLINEMGRLDDLMNVEEAEFLVATSAERRIVSVQRLPASAQQAPSALIRYSGAIRWGGRLVFLAGIGLSAYRVADAAPERRHVVVGEEVGGQVGGAVGTAAGVAGCVFFGIATGGVGLLACGLVGGAVLGFGGSALGGAIAESAGERGEEASVCPSCHALQREWSAQRQWHSSFPGLTTGPNGELTATEIARLRAWLQTAPERTP